MEDNRKYFIQFTFIIVGLIYCIKLFQIQFLDDTYGPAAEDNILRKIRDYSYRGIIYDRNGELLVHNDPVFDLMVIPKEAGVKDTAKFCAQLGIEKEEFILRMNEVREYDIFQPSVFMKMLSIEDFAKFQDFLVDYPGFYPQVRSLRGYEHESLANALGYVGEISKTRLERDTTGEYKQGDYIGISGVELEYEKELKGQNGIKYKMVNVRGVVKGSFKNGRRDTISLPGENLTATVDLELQQYGEWLMEGLAGGLVAIEPETGEILSLISSPSYSPGFLSGRLFSKNFAQLTLDSLKPLFNRAIMSVYPPGSTFKPLQALIALQEGVITPKEQIYCSGALVGDHAPPGYYDVYKAIQKSSNNYFYIVFKRIINRNRSENTFVDSRLGLEKWNEYLYRFGLGRPLGIDIPNEKGGQIPSPQLYNGIYGENRWKWSTINSISIGQGEILTSPLQMANYSAAIANRGYFYTPHIIKEIGASGKPKEEYLKKHLLGIDTAHFRSVIDAMDAVVNAPGGTGFRAAIPGITVCGKTGTSQNPHGEDHSVFIAFAPKENPKIAISVYVQNAGQGARAAASIAGLMIEKYLTKEIKKIWIEDYVKRGHFIY
ncbi:MAG: penicillin-binding protein 2 [Cytophagales bacterium]|nr:penicillin-binding protein 2 [Cytophagales bacterium]